MMSRKRMIEEIDCQQLRGSTLQELVQQSKSGLFLGCLFTSATKESLFILRLKVFIQRLAGSNILNQNQGNVLKLMVDDYQQGLWGAHDEITDVIVQKIKTSELIQSLSQEPPDIDPATISPLHRMLTRFNKAQMLVTQLADSQKKQFVLQHFLPALRHLIDKKQAIVDQMLARPGVLYTLDLRIPFHLDHITNARMSPTQENGNAILDNLIDMVLSSIENAHQIDALNVACELMASGHCFESRTRDLIDQYAFIGTQQQDMTGPTFESIVEHCLNDEYLPHTSMMAESSGEPQTNSIQRVSAFIMARYQGKTCCVNPQYAPSGTIESAGLEAYLANRHHYQSDLSDDRQAFVTAIDSHITRCTHELSNCMNYFNQSAIKAQVDSLILLKRQVIDDNLASLAARHELEHITNPLATARYDL